MVEIIAYVATWDFQRGVETLMRGFREAIAALDRVADQKGTELLDYEESLRNGAEPIGEWDDDGSLLWDDSHRLQMEIEELHGARMALRKAIVIQLYHQWERTTRRTTVSKQGDNFEVLVGKLRAKQEPVHDRMRAVNLLVNTLKHGNPKQGEALANAWPEVVSRSIEYPDWYDRITLSDDQVLEVAEAIVASGPQLHFKLGGLLEHKLSL